MKSLVFQTQIQPIFRKYPGVPKVPEQLSAVPMIVYREKDEKRFVLKTDQLRKEDFYIRYIPHVPL
jgi:hypothetical protein